MADPFLSNPVQTTGVTGSAASSFFIRTLNGGPSNTHTLELIGRGLPYPGLKTPGTMRREKTWYQGNPTATLQIIGPTEDETSINGEWKDKYIGAGANGVDLVISDGTPCSSAAAAVEAMDSFRRAGQLLEVSWGPVTRTGILAEFEPDWENEHDVKWTAKFDWISRGATVPPPSFSVNPPSPAGLQSSLDLMSAYLFGCVPMPVDMLAGIVDAMALIGAAIQHAQDIQDSADSTATSMTTSARATAAAFRSVVTAARALAVLVRSMTPADFFFSADPGMLALGLVLSGAGAQRILLGYTRDISTAAAVMCSDIEASVGDTSDLESSILARDGMDLRGVSTAFHGTPAKWQLLMTYNGLSSSKLVAGQVVLVPALSSQVGT